MRKNNIISTKILINLLQVNKIMFISLFMKNMIKILRI